MGGMFSAPSIPAPPPPPPDPPDRDASRGDVSEARKRAANAKGRTSTILTSGQGVDTDDSFITKKTLLGGGIT